MIITHDAVEKLIYKYQKTGTFANQPQSVPRHWVTDKDI